MTEVLKFRKRPVVIEAMHFASTEDVNPIINWIKAGGGQAHRNVRVSDQALVIVIETLEGDMAADIGDFIIRGVAGEHYACKPGIFAQTYETTEKKSLHEIEMTTVREGKGVGWALLAITIIVLVLGFWLGS